MIRGFVLGLAVATIVGTAASGMPMLTHVVMTRGGIPSVSTSPCDSESPTPVPIGSPKPLPSESPGTSSGKARVHCPSPGPSPRESPDPSPTPGTGSLTCPTPPSPPAGGGKLVGLDNAMAHVYANCVAHPNSGLVNALNRLISNKAKHDARKTGDNSHGKSADAPGHAQSSGGGLGHATPHGKKSKN
jgi:hypothetical protein